MTKHLDIGCGSKPRNPFRRDSLFGVDIRALDVQAATVLAANLVLDPIPFPTSHFDSVSAYDFLEHVPRIFPDARTGTRFPFVELMNEIWRVLVPGGRFYACTPVYPHPTAFQDPTHVNILTRDSHIYFCRPKLLARMYGFAGDFAAVRVLPVKGGEFEYEPVAPPNFTRRYRLRRRERRQENTHIVWEFEAKKPVSDLNPGVDGN